MKSDVNELPYATILSLEFSFGFDQLVRVATSALFTSTPCFGRLGLTYRGTHKFRVLGFSVCCWVFSFEVNI